MKYTKIYIVCYVIEKASCAISKEYEDKFRVFIDGDSEQNLHEANKFYNKIINKKKTYSANICQIIKSTDYDT